jgi:hypothetical protein
LEINNRWRGWKEGPSFCNAEIFLRKLFNFFGDCGGINRPNICLQREGRQYPRRMDGKEYFSTL